MNRQKLIIGLLIATIILLVINITSKYVPYINVNRNYSHVTDVYSLEGVKITVKWDAKYKAPLIFPDVYRNQIEGKLKGYMFIKLHLFVMKYNVNQLRDLTKTTETFQTAFDLEELAPEIKSIKFQELKIEILFRDGMEKPKMTDVIASGVGIIDKFITSIF